MRYEGEPAAQSPSARMMEASGSLLSGPCGNRVCSSESYHLTTVTHVTLTASAAMSGKGTFFEQYQKAFGRTEAPPGLITAACLYVFDLKVAGLSADDIAGCLQEIMRDAGGQSPATARLDADIMLHCIEQYHRPVPPLPKPPDFLG